MFLYLGLLSPRLLRLLFLFLLLSLFLPLGSALLWFFFLLLIVSLLGRRGNVLLSYMTGLPGNLEFFFVFIVKVIETVEFVWSLEAFLDILDDFGSDATPMTPRTVVGTLECLKGRDHRRRETHTTRFCL